MTQSTRAPRPLSFDALLWEVIDASDDEVEAVLARCPDPEIRSAVREVVAEADRGERAGDSSPSANSVTGSEATSRTLDTSASTSRDAGNRRRIWRTVRYFCFMATLLGVLATINHVSRAGRWSAGVVAELAVLWSIVALSFVFLAVARSPRFEDRRITRLALAYVVVLCGQFGFFHASHEFDAYGVVTAFGPFVIVMGFFPLVIDASWKAIYPTIAGSGLSSFVGLAAGLWTEPEALGSSFATEVAIGLLFGIGLSVGTQRGMEALRREAAAGPRLGSYRLKEQLGRGGMGEVWRATHPLLTRTAAIKLIRGVHLAGDPELRERVLSRFRREARITASLRSEHTVRLFDYGVTEDGNAFMVMELLRGFDLQEMVHRFGSQPVDRVVPILVAICDSLAEAHEQGLVHRDVKPANVMLCSQGRAVDHVKVLDFGSVVVDPAVQEGSVQITYTSTLLGTPSYLAPEILSGETTADARSDLYGVGCVAYWLLVGRTVFDFASTMMQVAAHLRDRPEAPSKLGVALPDEIESIVLSCLEKDPNARPQSAADLATQLESIPAVGDWNAGDARRWWADHLPTGDRLVASDESVSS